MHVVHLIARLNDGGPARVVAALATGTLLSGAQCSVWHGAVGSDEADLGPQLAAAGIPLREISGLGRSVAPGHDLRALFSVLRLLRSQRPDLVHTHTAKAGAIGRLACAILGIPCLHSYHGHVLHGYFRPGVNQIVRRVERVLGRRAHHHSLTPSLVRELSGHGIGRAQRWHCLPIPVPQVTPTRAPWPREATPVIGFLGRLAPVKDIRLWLLTLAQIRRQRPVTGLVCGDGAQRAMAEGLAKRLRLPVRFTGTVPAGQALAGMDLLLMSSRNEGLPLVAVEAAAAGVPVVAPAVGGLADLGTTGLVHAVARNSAALSAACCDLLSNADRRESQVQRARLLSGTYSPAALIPLYLACYRSILHV
ncbi:MAG: glycosyltransferase [Planctomycetota bacterium]|jgi:glycosyltransferase involved in cell wall biosynthesis|nr:glycosyltransferase [Planctomycetota bacterium]